MPNISSAGASYQNQINLWNKRQVESSSIKDSESDAKKEANTVEENKKDTVTISQDVSLAQRREKLGHRATGKLTKRNFQAVVEADEKAVEETLKTAIESFALESKQVITFSRDSEGSIIIQEEFELKEEIEEFLNDNAEFKQRFNRLSSNREILDFSKKLETKSNRVNLFSLLNNEASSSDSRSLMMIAEKYKELKAGKDSFEIMTSLSRNETPFGMSFEVA